MSETHEPRRRTRDWLASAAVLLSLPLLGAVAGGAVASSLSDQVGWDQLADFIGGAMAGLAVGVVLAAVLLMRAGSRTRLIVASIGLALTLGVVLAFWMSARARGQPNQQVVPIPRPTTPPPAPGGSG